MWYTILLNLLIEKFIKADEQDSAKRFTNQLVDFLNKHYLDKLSYILHNNIQRVRDNNYQPVLLGLSRYINLPSQENISSVIENLGQNKTNFITQSQLIEQLTQQCRQLNLPSIKGSTHQISQVLLRLCLDAIQ